MKIFRGESLVDAQFITDKEKGEKRENRIRIVKECVPRNCYPSKMLVLKFP